MAWGCPLRCARSAVTTPARHRHLRDDRPPRDGNDKCHWSSPSDPGPAHPTIDSVLALDTGMDIPTSGLSLPLLTGRVPPLTALVRLSSGDGCRMERLGGHGHFLIWLPAHVPSARIDALAADGTWAGSQMRKWPWP